MCVKQLSSRSRMVNTEKRQFTQCQLTRIYHTTNNIDSISNTAGESKGRRGRVRTYLQTRYGYHPNHIEEAIKPNLLPPNSISTSSEHNIGKARDCIIDTRTSHLHKPPVPPRALRRLPWFFL